MCIPVCDIEYVLVCLECTVMQQIIYSVSVMYLCVIFCCITYYVCLYWHTTCFIFRIAVVHIVQHM